MSSTTSTTTTLRLSRRLSRLRFSIHEAKAVKDNAPLSSSLHAPSSKQSNTISPSTPQSSNGSPSGCINYDPSTRTITVSCSSARLTDIDNKLHDGDILTKQSPNGIWFLSANLLIAKGATFHIDSTDTRWLKIGSSPATSGAPSSTANSIDVHGSLTSLIPLLHRHRRHRRPLRRHRCYHRCYHRHFVHHHHFLKIQEKVNFQMMVIAR